MIESDKLTKYYGIKAAAQEVSFQLKKGEILGFLGPNGAGKSTTMKMLTTFLYPTSGTAVVNGFDILKDPIQVRENVGYLPENAPLYDDMQVKDFLLFAAQARKVKPAKGAVERVLKECFIEEVKNQPIYTLSKGYRQRVCFAQAIIHDPDILILDEPTDGLDPNQKTEVREMISRMGEGKAILLSTHILEEAIATCSRAIIISQGQIKVDDTPENLLRKDPNYGSVKLKVQANVDDADGIVSELKKVNYVSEAEASVNDEYLSTEGVKVYNASVRPDKGHEISGAVLDSFKKKNWEVLSINVNEGRLEDVFRSYTEDSK